MLYRVDFDRMRSSRDRLADPLKSASGFRPSLGRWPQQGHAKLHREHVREMRRWARREGFGLALAEQVRALQVRYPLSEHALASVLKNESWYAPDYDRETPDPVWWTATPALCLLFVLMRSTSKERTKCA